MASKKDLPLATLGVHAGENRDIKGAVAFPIFQTSTFVFKNTKELVKYIQGGKDLYQYTRYGNPTLSAAEEKLARLEGGEAGLLFSSGMAAITTTVLSLVKSGDEIVASRSLYGGTFRFFTELLPKLGVRAHCVDSERIADAERFINRRTKLIYIETPTNPNLKIVDLRKTAQIARRHRLISIIDNTFATPVNQRPLDFGVDISIHSGTKYLGGHADIIAGAVAGPAKLVKEIRSTLKVLGGVADPHMAFLLLRGMATLKLRVERQSYNSLELAFYLSSHPKVKRVLHPGLTSHPQHELAKSQMTGFGGMVCLEVKGGVSRAVKVIDSFKVILNAASLGGVQSLASLPVYSSHYGFSPTDLRRADVTPGMIRISCGIEDAEVLKDDLRQALAKA